MTRRPVILDTDIGTDVDDILALTLIAKLPELELLGVTTVYGDTRLRAQMCRYVCNQLGLEDVPVFAGEQQTLTGRDIFWAGHEGKGVPGLEDIPVMDGDAVSWLVETARQYNGELEIAAIGPLTNIARAIQRDPGFGANLKRLYLMGGAFYREYPEHNIKCDPEAAEVVFDSGIPITVSGLDVTTVVFFREPEVTAIGKSNGELGESLEQQLRIWWEYTGEKQNNPHDPLAVLAMVRPDLFTWNTGEIEVGLGDTDLAFTRPEHRADGSVNIAAGVDAPAAEAEMLRIITS